jgi:hypothetical protein
MQYANRTISQPPANSAFNIAGANAGVQIKTGPGTLSSVAINTGVAGATVELFDGTSTAGKPLGIYSAAAQTGALPQNIAFTTGLFAVTSAATNVTIGFQ